MRKILKNNNKSERITGTSKGRIGTLLNIMDKNNTTLSVGDTVRYGEYSGVLLYNYDYGQYVVALDYSMWYDDNKYDIDSYGNLLKFLWIMAQRWNLKKWDKISGLSDR